MNTIKQQLKHIEQLLMLTVKRVLNTAEAATMLNITPGHLRHLVSTRQVPHYKKGSRIYFSKSELEQWQLQNRVASSEELNSQALTKHKPRKQS